MDNLPEPPPPNPPSNPSLGWGGRLALTLFAGVPAGIFLGAAAANSNSGAGMFLGFLPLLVGSYWVAGAWTKNIGARLVLAVLLTVGLIATIIGIFFVGCLMMAGGRL